LYTTFSRPLRMSWLIVGIKAFREGKTHSRLREGGRKGAP
jgi:hypothetical protein